MNAHGVHLYRIAESGNAVSFSSSRAPSVRGSGSVDGGNGRPPAAAAADFAAKQQRPKALRESAASVHGADPGLLLTLLPNLVLTLAKSTKCNHRSRSLQIRCILTLFLVLNLFLSSSELGRHWHMAQGEVAVCSRHCLPLVS